MLQGWIDSLDALGVIRGEKRPYRTKPPGRPARENRRAAAWEAHKPLSLHIAFYRKLDTGTEATLPAKQAILPSHSNHKISLFR